jgi:hypothetical protein
MQGNCLQIKLAQFVRETYSLKIYSILAKGKARIKTYHYQLADIRQNFAFEPLKRNEKDYLMTAQEPGVRCGDRIALHDGASYTKYWISSIEYYCDPPDMWTAQLRPCRQKHY